MRLSKLCRERANQAELIRKSDQGNGLRERRLHVHNAEPDQERSMLTLITAAGGGCAIDSKWRSGDIPSSARGLRGSEVVNRFERERRPQEVRVKELGDWDKGGAGVNCLERCYFPEIVRTKGDEARDRDELCAQEGRGIAPARGSVAQWHKAGTGLNSLKMKMKAAACTPKIAKFRCS
ncbi:hypothetical protein DFH09DRAFT_1088422 [Mycena vulgaris]|nr:hypothetical protein DFH09DRAFT_1088422 [Mycena vulgaris]